MRLKELATLTAGAAGVALGATEATVVNTVEKVGSTKAVGGLADTMAAMRTAFDEGRAAAYEKYRRAPSDPVEPASEPALVYQPA